MTGQIPPGYRNGRHIVLTAVVAVVLVLVVVAGATGAPEKLYASWLGVARGLWSWVGGLFT